MWYDLCDFAHLCKRGKLGCFERLILAVCWWLTAHFCNNMSKNAFCFVFWAGGVLPRPAPLQFQWKSLSDYPTPFFIAGFWFSFSFFDRRTKEHIFYFGRWLLAFGSLYCHVFREPFLFLSADRSWNKFRMTLAGCLLLRQWLTAKGCCFVGWNSATKV